MRFLPDKFTCMLIATILLASFLPVQGDFAEWFGIATKIAVGLLFFLHGARLSREAVVAGVTHWRLHLAVVCSTFVLFPILGLTAGWTIPGLAQSPFYLGILYLRSSFNRTIFNRLYLYGWRQCFCGHRFCIGIEYFRHVPDAVACRTAVCG